MRHPTNVSTAPKDFDAMESSRPIKEKIGADLYGKPFAEVRAYFDAAMKDAETWLKKDDKQQS